MDNKKDDNYYVKKIIDNINAIINYTKELSYEEFVSNFLNYFEIEEENKNLALKKPNPYFVEVQKNLIDMMMAKNAIKNALGE